MYDIATFFGKNITFKWVHLLKKQQGTRYNTVSQPPVEVCLTYGLIRPFKAPRP